MLWTMGAVCVAVAVAVELSLRTLSASAALIGAATLALTSDIAARSGSGSTQSASSSAVVRSVVERVRVSMLVSSFRGLDALRDRGRLLGVRGGGRAIGQHVRGEPEVHGDCEVGVDERHRRAVGQRLDGQALDVGDGELGGGLVRGAHVLTSCVPCWDIRLT